ncbi:hypothetical protein AGDE_16465 [Angomonas deanei]|nr:hypothetical protein AGDE_16465 [Angomonas deanei]|eukprot:EPY17027.1 hypothetical protein AGDE_16465 [Angomonas deanei]
MSKFPLRWDHVVHLVNDVQAPVGWFQKSGLTARPGGEHPRWGTINSLSQFGLTYIEFITLKDKEKLRQLQEQREKVGAGFKASEDNCLVNDIVAHLPVDQRLTRVAIRCDKHAIESLYDRLKKEGLRVMEMVPGARRTTTGDLLEWKIFFVDGEGEQPSGVTDAEERAFLRKVAYPFFLEWGQETDAARLEWLDQSGGNPPHPLGAVTLQHLVWQVEKPEVLARRWSQLLQMKQTTVQRPNGETAVALEAGEGGQLFIFEKGDANGITALEMVTDNATAKGTTVKIGDADYRFI